jgi:hypothetical protein
MIFTIFSLTSGGDKNPPKTLEISIFHFSFRQLKKRLCGHQL